MTTILKAVQEIEARSGATPPPTTTSYDERPGTASHVLVRVLLALGVGVAIGAAAVAVHTSRSASPEPAALAHEAAHVAAPPAHADAPHPRNASSATIVDAPGIHSGHPAQDAVAPEEQPWGRVERKSAAGDAAHTATVEPPSPRAAAPAAELQPRPADGRRAAIPPRRLDARAAEASSRRGDAAAPGDARSNANARATTGAHTAGAHASSGWTPAGVRVEVTAIDSTDNAGGSTATLRIGDRTVTLHQGDSASGLEVQLIRPDAVYLRSGRDIFAVDAPPSRR